MIQGTKVETNLRIWEEKEDKEALACSRCFCTGARCRLMSPSYK